MLSGNHFFRSRWPEEWRKSSRLFPVRRMCNIPYSTLSSPK